MGIFGDILGGLEDIARGPIGQAAGQIGGQILLERFGRPRAGPPIIIGTVPGPVPQFPALAVGPVVQAGRTLPFAGAPPSEALRELALTTLGGGPPMPGVFQTTALGGIVQAPQPVPFGIDPACPSFFRTGAQTARPTRFITATNPVSGALTFWEHAGAPILFTRDLQVVKRVRRIASKAGTVSRRRSRKR